MKGIEAMDISWKLKLRAGIENIFYFVGCEMVEAAQRFCGVSTLKICKTQLDTALSAQK